jgi:hypothetical protein
MGTTENIIGVVVFFGDAGDAELVDGSIICPHLIRFSLVLVTVVR